jgi:hypothetical protein
MSTATGVHSHRAIDDASGYVHVLSKILSIGGHGSPFPVVLSWTGQSGPMQHSTNSGATRQSQVVRSRNKYRKSEASKCPRPCIHWSLSATNVRCGQKTRPRWVEPRPRLHYENCRSRRDGFPTPKVHHSAGASKCQRGWGRPRRASTVVTYRVALRSGPGSMGRYGEPDGHHRHRHHHHRRRHRDKRRHSRLCCRSNWLLDYRLVPML